MSTPVTQTLDIYSPRSGFKAWLMSVAFHTTALIGLAIALFAVRPPKSLPQDEPGRKVEIAVVQSSQSPSRPFADKTPRPRAADPSKASAKSAAKPSPFPANEASARPLDSGVLPTSTDPHGIASGTLMPGLVNSSGGQPTIPTNFDEAAFIAAERAARRPSSPTGPVAETSIFGVKATGRSFVFLLDSSKSMGGTGLGAIEAAERELAQTLTRLDARHKFQVIAYNDRRTYLQDKLAPATDVEKDACAKFLAGIVGFGGTDHYAAVTAALRSNPEVIVVLTDGEPKELTSAMLRQIQLRASGRTTIHTIHFASRPRAEGADEHFIAKLARLTGGTYAYIDMSGR